MTPRALLREPSESEFLGDSTLKESRKSLQISLLPDRDACLTGTLQEVTSLPEWFSELAKEVVCLMSLPPDWDSYGADPIDAATVQDALKALVLILKPGLPQPRVFPDSAGGVGFEFHTSNAELTLIVHPTSGTSFYLEDLINGQDQEGEGLPESLDGLISVR